MAAARADAKQVVTIPNSQRTLQRDRWLTSSAPSADTRNPNFLQPAQTTPGRTIPMAPVALGREDIGAPLKLKVCVIQELHFAKVLRVIF